MKSTTKCFTIAKVCNNRIIKTLCIHLFIKDFEKSTMSINLFHPYTHYTHTFSVYVCICMYSSPYYVSNVHIHVHVRSILWPLHSYPALSHIRVTCITQYKIFNIMMEKIFTIKLQSISRKNGEIERIFNEKKTNREKMGEHKIWPR